MPLLRRRTAALLAATVSLPLTLAAVVAVTPSPAHADDASTLTVVGTSDVFDSGLSDGVLKPGFEAYEQSLGKDVTYNYVSRGTGAAIDYAKAGTASALIVHAASLENQFVDQGYSLEQYGRAFTWGDYVLLGHPADPAHVLTTTTSPATASHDIVSTFEKIATAGAAGTARFVSRGGTPGTTVQEHAIWALTTGVPLCAVPAANGGGMSPVNADPGTAVCGSQAASPAWYTATGSNQALNVENADACNYNDASNGNHDICYVFTDKGTFEFLRSSTPPAINDLVTVAADNTVSGQENLLINSFHAYAINPAKFAGNPNVQINAPAALDFLTWVTSPAGQQLIADYLSDDPDGAPFRPSAAPVLTDVVDPSATTVKAGQTITFSGTLTNPTPGTPPLAGFLVHLQARPAGSDPSTAATTVASDTTDADGHYSITYRPTSSSSYVLSSDPISQVENSTLDPVFGDLLQPSSTEAGTVAVQGVVKATHGVAGGRSGFLKVNGTLAPVAPAGAGVVVYAAHPDHVLKARFTKKLAAGSSTYALTGKLGRGTWTYEVRYVSTGDFVTGTGAAKTIKLK